MPGVSNIAVLNRLIRDRYWGESKAEVPAGACARSGVERLIRIPHRLRHGLAFAVLLAAGLTAACAPRDAYPVHRLDDRGLRVIERRVFWLDNDTLAFAAQRIEDRGDPDREDPVNIYLWRPGQEKERLYRKGVWADSLEASSGYFCAADGRLSYATGPARSGREPGEVAFPVLEGPPGREEPGTFVSHYLRGQTGATQTAQGLLPANHIWSVSARKSGVSCREHVDPTMTGKGWAETASPEHYIVFEQNARTYAYSRPALLDRRSGTLTPIPVNGGEVFPSCVLHTPWDGATWMWACLSRPMPRSDQPEMKPALWRVDIPSGETTSTEIPLDLSTLILSPAPSARGFLFYGSTDAGQDGLFRFAGPTRQQLVPGRFRAAVTSPDGCRIALSEAASGAPDDNRVVVVDVCRGT